MCQAILLFPRILRNLRDFVGNQPGEIFILYHIGKNKQNYANNKVPASRRKLIMLFACFLRDIR